MHSKAFIIAELSANHGGKIETAIETVKAAKRSGADAIKLQTYTADTITIDCDKDDFMISQGTHWDGQYLYELYSEASLPWEWHRKLFDVAKDEGLVCFSSPFDKTAVDFLQELDCPIYKIASLEIVDIPLIEYIASKGKPVIISTGIATTEDIYLAIEACHRMNNHEITILQCTTAYPAQPADANLKTIEDIQTRFNVKAGLSDHTLGIEAPMVAVAMGATVIEKHFILDKSVGGADAHFSLDEIEFTKMVEAVRLTESMMGKVDYEMTDAKLTSRQFARSLYVVEDIKAGEALTENNVRSIRPGFGMHPRYYHEVLGRKALKSIERGSALRFELIESV